MQKLLYQDVQHLMDSGDFLFIKGRSAESWLIKIGTFARFTHVCILVWIEFNGVRRLCVFEATTGHGVRLYPLDRYLAEKAKIGEVVFWYKLAPDLDRISLISYACMHWGKRYANRWQLIYSFGWLTGLFRKAAGLPVKDTNPDRFFCSEFGANGLHHAGAEVDEPASYSPGDLAEHPKLRNQGEVVFRRSEK